MENILNNLVRIGTVSAVDNAHRKVRVLYRDKDNMTSDWLFVLQHPGAVHIENNGEHLHTITGENLTDLAGEHAHEASVSYWMPAVNDTVLALYLPVFNGDGYVLGVV